MGLTACAPRAAAPPHDPASLTDTAGDGTPDLLRLDSPADRRAFRRWFTFLAELQYYRDPARVPREILDCAALVRFAYREALKKHDGAWASALDLDTVPAESSVQKYVYPATPLGANLFRIKPGRFLPMDLARGAFAQFADANNLRRFNAHFLTRDIHDAQPGDLLFYNQLEQNQPFHVMIFLGRSQLEPGAESRIVYHTGPIGTGPGEIRRPSVQELLRHPSPRWRPKSGNANFLGVYRWNILRDSSL